MSSKGALHEDRHVREQAPGRVQRAYTITEICVRLSIPRSSFFQLRAGGQLPFLEELKPRLGRVVRYRADLVDRYASGQWDRARSFGKAS